MIEQLPTPVTDLDLRRPPLHEPLMTFREAMTYLRVSRSTVYRLMWSGQLTGHKVGSTWRFYASELRASVQDATPNAPTTRP